jgi:hypothetical protein
MFSPLFAGMVKFPLLQVRGMALAAIYYRWSNHVSANQVR